MTDKQQPILVLGKEYFPEPSPHGGCGGCAGLNNSTLCVALPFCPRTIFVERKPGEVRDLNGKVLPQPDDSDINQVHDGNARPDTLLEVSVLCDQARADGYAKGMAARQAEWDKWKANTASVRDPSVLDPSGAAGIYGVARTYGTATSHKAARSMAHTSDPATSHKAAQGMGRKAGRIADLILVELRDANLTGSMLSKRTGVALNSITPRFAQLFRKGLIHAAGVSGRETVWAIGNGIHVAPRPDAPVSHWCVGCTPDNCAGCDGSAASNVATA